MPSDIHHLSFTDHLALYLPYSLRPALPRDLRHLTASPVDEEGSSAPPPPPPMSTPQEHDEGVHDRDASAEASSSRRSDAHSHTRHGSEPDTPCEESRSKGGSREEEGGLSERTVGNTVMQEEERKKKKKKKERSKEGYHVSLILTNSGSVARDHLASERTFLAYVRTSLALASTGVALVQLFTIADSSGSLSHAQNRFVHRFATPLGSLIIILGLITLLLGCLRYFAIQVALTRGAFPAARLTVVFIVVVLSVLTGVVFGVLVKGRSDSL